MTGERIKNLISSILGIIKIERKTDILSLAAFLIALTSALFQASAYLRGAEVELFSPD